MLGLTYVFIVHAQNQNWLILIDLVLSFIKDKNVSFAGFEAMEREKEMKLG